jgi:TatD DNase family protein
MGIFSSCVLLPSPEKLETPLPPFLNLHSHRKPSGNDELAIRNAFLHLPKSNFPENYRLSFGIHPWFAAHASERECQTLASAAKNPACLAIGECGIDRVKGPGLATQLDVFKMQVDLANQINKPLILHLVRSYSDVLQFASSIKVPWIVHGFNGNKQMALMLIDKGARLSFGVAFLNRQRLKDVLNEIPIAKLYLETDTVAYPIQLIYREASAIRNTSIDSLRNAIWTNFERDFLHNNGK